MLNTFMPSGTMIYEITTQNKHIVEGFRSQGVTFNTCYASRTMSMIKNLDLAHKLLHLEQRSTHVDLLERMLD
jgi:hypothetical protein